ncbi:hypothetical protein K505DRAFT_117610, partial [Melanomma pulvis-pyrius CBS 109.77]
MSEFHGPIDGHIVIPGTHTAAGGTTNFHFSYPSTQERPTRPREPFSTVPFAPDPDFVDRPDILAWVRNKCAQPGARAALVGLGGVGKSQLAIQYAHSLRNATPPRFVFWVYASTQARFKEAYRDIADRLQLPGRLDPKVDILRLVSNWLCDETNGQWMIILDNADDIEVFYPKQGRAKVKQLGSFVTSLTDYLPQSCNGSILITSRSHDTAARLAGGHTNIKEIDRLDEGQALQLLQNKLHDTPSSEDTSNLLRTLDYLPLAITQAAAYIHRHAPRATISSYINEFQRSDQSKENLLNQDAGDLRRDRSASNAVVTTWQITFRSVQRERRSAAELLSLMSFFNPQGIPEFALQNYRQSSDAKTINVKRLFSVLHKARDGRAQDDFYADISILQAYSLVSSTAERSRLKMHPLVQLCTRAWLSSTGKLKEWRSKFLAQMTRELAPENVGNWTEYQQLVLHIEGFYQSNPTGRSLEKWLLLIGEVGALLLRKGKYEEAGKLYQRVLEEKEKNLGVHHPDTLGSVNSLAVVLGSQGKYNEAEKL